MRLLAAGSVALDELEGPFGRATGVLGGSALYFALAASLLHPVEIVAPVGTDVIEQVRRMLGGRSVDTSRLLILDQPTYRWSAIQQAGTNLDRGSQDTIYDAWDPEIPAGFDGWAFVGSMRADKQAAAAGLLRSGALLLAGDSMRSYVDSRPAEARLLLEACDWFFANREELTALGGDPDRAQAFRERWSLSGLVVKAGAAGCSASTGAGELHLSALRTLPVVDVTGAGDALAGGMLARWLATGGHPEGLRDALAHGIACATLAISAIGLDGLVEATAEDLGDLAGEVLG